MSEVKTLRWTAQHVQRFWDYWALREDAQDTYFAKHWGPAVVAFLEQARRLQGAEVLDFGAGPGYLVEHLLARKASVSAVDYSLASIAALNDRHRTTPGWQGAKQFDEHRLPWPAETFDVVCCLETVEHVLDEHTDSIFQELHRVLKVGGLAVLTTPNDENLREADVYCPNCDSEFHRWQHVRAWTAEGLSARLTKHGYGVPFCAGINLQRFDPAAKKGWRHVCFADLERSVKIMTRTILDAVAPRPFPQSRTFQARRGSRNCPHLVAVAQKQASTITPTLQTRRHDEAA